MKTNQTLIRNRTLLTASVAAALSLTPLHHSVGAPDPIAPSQFEEPRPITQSHAEALPPEGPSLRIAITAFKKNPSAENRSSMKLALARVDLKIAELRDRKLNSTGPERANAVAKLDDLQQYRSAQMHRLSRNTELALNAQEHNRTSEKPGIAIQVKDTALDVKDKAISGAKSVGEKGMRITKKAAIKTEVGAEKVAEKVEEGGSKVKRTLQRGAEKTGEEIHDATH